MKTTLHLPHPHPRSTVTARGAAAAHRPPTRIRSTVRIGIVLSVLAAVVTIALEAVLDVPMALIVVPVVVVGFVLSWHASGRSRESEPAGRATMSR